ncbi:MAG: hypothetical protein ABIG40_02595 [Parcubacteria group bacterium]
MDNIFFKWLIFQFFDAPKEILKAWRNFLIFNLNYFSIPVLLRTLFAYWRKYSWDYPRGFDFLIYLEVAASNLISRILGAIMRIILICLGIAVEIFIFFLGGAVLLIWLILPVLIIFGIYHGARILL